MKTIKTAELKITAIYLAVSVIWITLTDKFFLPDTPSITTSKLTNVQTLKGLAFIFFTGLLIYYLTQRLGKKSMDMQEEYDELFLDNPNAMWIFDLETFQILKVNKAAIFHYGYSELEFLSMNVKDITADDDMPKVEEYISNFNESLCTPVFWKQKKKNGEVLVAKVTMHTVIFVNRKCRLALSHDVTRKKLLEQDLLQSYTELNILVKSITDGFYIIDNHFTILKHNEELKKLVEVETDILVGRNLFELFPSSRNNLSHEQFAKAFETKQSVHYEIFHPHRNTWFRVSAYPFENVLSVFFRDITKAKEYDLKLAQNEQNLNALINNTEDLIWSIDTDFKYHTFNNNYEKEYRRLFRQNIWRGKVAFSEGKGIDHMLRWKALYERALKGESFSADMEFPYPNGSRVLTTIRFNPIFDLNNKVTGVGCFLHNVTQRKLHLEKIEEQNKKLKEMAFTISHTVRAPLANLLGLYEAFDKTNPSNPDNAQIIEYIKISSQKLGSVVEAVVQETVPVDENE